MKWWRRSRRSGAARAWDGYEICRSKTDDVQQLLEPFELWEMGKGVLIFKLLLHLMCFGLRAVDACPPACRSSPCALPACRDHDVDVVTLGQYMRPTKRHMPVAEYVTPEAFQAYQQVGRAACCAGCSSPHAAWRLGWAQP
jgi:hypothetical protein